MDTPKPEPMVYNACSGKQTTINRLAALIGKIAGREPQTVYEAARPGDIRYSAGEPSLARDRLGVTADTSIEDGLRLTYESLV
jgi:UDP-glucose 4-epimerase